MCADQRPCDEHGLDDVFGTVDVGCAHNLYVAGLCVGHLCDDGGHILIYVGREDGLDHEHVVVALYGLHHTEIVHITVTVQVEVAEHVRRVVDQVLEFLHCGGLCEGCTYCLEVEVERDVVIGGHHACGRGHDFGFGHCDARAVGDRSGVGAVGGCVGHCHDTCREATCQQQGHQGQND